MFNWFTPKRKYFTLNIHMKSGKTLVFDQVLEWKATNSTNSITYLYVEQLKTAETEIFVNTIALSQIEAITINR